MIVVNIEAVFLSYELLKQRSSNFFCKEPNSKSFRLGTMWFLL